jgi:MFS family permease
MYVFAVIGLLFSLSTTPVLSLIILVASGTFWLLSLNPSNTANQLLATDANRGRVLSVMLLAQQGGMPLGHLCAGFLTHYMSPPWVLRLMLGTLLVVMVAFLFVREPAIDAMPHRRLGKLTFWATFGRPSPLTLTDPPIQRRSPFHLKGNELLCSTLLIREDFLPSRSGRSTIQMRSNKSTPAKASCA